MKKHKFISLLPLLVVFAVLFSWVLIYTGVFYVKTSITTSRFQITVEPLVMEDGIQYEVNIINGGSIDLGMKVLRIRMNDAKNQYIWFDNWNFDHEMDIVRAQSTLTFNVFMDMPQEKLDKALLAAKPIVDITGVYHLPKIGNVNFSSTQVVSLDE